MNRTDKNALLNVKWWCYKSLGTEEKAYWNKEVATILGIGESTVRKWCLELEKNGYTFVRGYKDSRAFLQHDLNALIHFKSLTKEGHFTAEQAAKMVVERYGNREEEKGENARTAPVLPEERYSIKNIEEMLGKLVSLSEEQVKSAKELNRVLIERIEKQDKMLEQQGIIIEEQSRQLRIAHEMNDDLTLLEHLQEDIKEAESAKNNDINDEADKEPVKKKRMTERIKSFFTK